jgi:hypothetical protein
MFDTDYGIGHGYKIDGEKEVIECGNKTEDGRRMTGRR